MQSSRIGPIESEFLAKGSNELVLFAFDQWDFFVHDRVPGFNKLGIVTRTGDVLYPKGRTIEIASIKEIERLRPLWVATVPVSIDLELIERFFLENVRSPQLFFAGTTAIGAGNFTYFENPIRVPKLSPIDSNEYQSRWRRLLETVQPGDLLIFANTSSRLSRFIAWVDSGTWSHSAMYSEDKMLLEAIPRLGLCKRPLSVYQTPNYRIGLFRAIHTKEEIHDALVRAEFMVGHGYSYRKAAIAGFCKFFGMERKAPMPNDLILHMNVKPIMFV